MNVQDILAYLKIVRRWWWVTLLLFVATLGTMFALSYLAEVEYQATVTVQVSAPPPQEVPLYSQFGKEALSDEIAQTRSSFSEFIQAGDTPYKTLEVLPDIPMGGRELRARTTVDLPDNSQLMRVRVRAWDPETAALLANTLVETGLQQYGQLLAQPTANTGEFIIRELEAAQQELGNAEADLMQFKIDNKIGSLEDAIRSHYDLILTLQKQVDQAQATGNLAQSQALVNIIHVREAELQNMIGLSAEYTALVDRVERARSTYSFLLDKKVEAQIKENQILESSYIQIITPARPPSAPLEAINKKLFVLGAVVSILGGVLLSFLLEYISTMVTSKDQKESEQSEDAISSDNES